MEGGKEKSDPFFELEESEVGALRRWVGGQGGGEIGFGEECGFARAAHAHIYWNGIELTVGGRDGLL